MERIEQVVEFVEGEAGRAARIRAVGITADVVNGNSRRYPREVLARAIAELKGHLHESAGQGRLMVQVLGEAEHPSDKPTGRPNLLETVVKWESVELPGDSDRVILEGTLLETAKGKDVRAVLKGGIQVGVSQRGYGVSRIEREGEIDVEVVEELHITGYDFVLEPSDPNGRVEAMLEAVSKRDGEHRRVRMDWEEFLEQLREEGILEGLAGAVREQIEAARRQEDQDRQMRMLREALGAEEGEDLVAAARRLAEQRTAARTPQTGSELEVALREELGLSDTDDLGEALRQREVRRQELEAAERARQVAAYIEEECANIEYPDWLHGQFVEAVQGTEPQTKEEARKAIIAKRKEYDQIVAQLELRARGYGGMRVLGPVLEQETGVPAFARVSHMLTENLVRHGLAKPRRWNRDPAEMSVNERLTLTLLEKFDAQFQQFLQAEAQQYAEAEQASDLSLPYSVSRAVIAEAVPELVAASIFDVGVTDEQSFRLYFETYAGETNAEVAVTDESVTITALGTWYELDYKRVQPGTVTVTNNAGTVTYDEGDDYAIDYANGEILGISGGDISAADVVKVDYTYDAIRLGENVAIERGKQTLDYVLVTAAADRLATQITSEAIEFARAQIGYDAVGRTLSALVREIREKIDQGMMYLGLGKALSVASNSGGTWSATPGGGDTYQQNLDKLFRYIGVAKVKVANRHYRPDFILATMTNADVMSNSEQFTAAGQRPDADLNAAGYVGRVKGLPVFASTQFSDSYLLVANRELVMHRVFRPMVIKGPYPTYDVAGSTSKLIAADQYFAEEYNVTESPVEEKGAYVKLTS